MYHLKTIVLFFKYHSEGNANLSQDPSTRIIAHDRARERLLYRDAAHWPQITFEGAINVHFGGERVRVIALPGGHTDNDVVVWFEEAGVVHLGDLMNAGTSSFPVADLAAGGNALTIRDNVERLLVLLPHDIKIIPGHGPLTNMGELHRLYQMLEETINVVAEQYEQGLSLDAIQAKGLPATYDDWGYGYMDAPGWIAMIYTSLEIKEAEKGLRVMPEIAR